MNCKAKLSSWQCKTVQSSMEDCIAVHAASVHMVNYAGYTAADKAVKANKILQIYRLLLVVPTIILCQCIRSVVWLLAEPDQTMTLHIFQYNCKQAL